MVSSVESSPPAAKDAPDLRREQMLHAAAELIGERGFSETRIADVARRSGASPALVIYYFEHQGPAAHRGAALLRAVVLRRRGGRARAAARPRGSGWRCSSRTTCVPEGEGEIPGAWGLWFDLWAQAFRHPEIAKDRIELDQRWRDTIAQRRARRPGRRRDRGGRRRRLRDHLLRAARRAVDPGRARGPGRRPGAGVRDRDGLRGPRAGRRLAAPAHAARQGGARQVGPRGR